MKNEKKRIDVKTSVLTGVLCFVFMGSTMGFINETKVEKLEVENTKLQETVAEKEVSVEILEGSLLELTGKLQKSVNEFKKSNDLLGQSKVELQKVATTSKETQDALAKEKEDLLKKVEALEKENSRLATDMDKTLKNKLIPQVKGVSYASNKIVGLGETVNVTATAYTAYCNGCTGETKTGIDVRHVTPKIIAVDPTLIPLKSKVELIVGGKSQGIYSAEDIGGAIKGNKIDILYPTTQSAYAFGVQEVELRIVELGTWGIE